MPIGCAGRGGRAMIAAIVVLAALAALALVALVAQLRGLSHAPAATPPAPPDHPGLALARRHCATCHLLPEPHALPRETWPFVVSWMGGYLGIPSRYETSSRLLIPRLVPPVPALSAEELAQIEEYYTRRSPPAAVLAAAVARPPWQLLRGFDVHVPSIDVRAESFVSMARIDPARGRVLIGRTGTLEIHDNRWRTIGTAAVETAVNAEATARGWRVDAIGDLFRWDRHEGAVLEVIETADGISATPIVQRLPRLVHHRAVDLDADGLGDLLLVSFGDDMGGNVGVRWGRPDGTHDETVVIDRQGAVGAEVRDVDGDGTLDILALMTQGRQELVLCRGLGGRRFEQRQLLEWPSSFGLNGFRLVDMDADGDEDLVLVNGNNVELDDPPLRPYHGIRVLTNRGSARFVETAFHPMHGATAVVAGDLDGDADVDLAACAFCPDWLDPHPESFVVLEQAAPGRFVPRRLPAELTGRWITLDLGDIDGDGDPDLLLGGGFVPTGVPERAKETYLRLVPRTPSLLLLRNRHRD